MFVRSSSVYFKIPQTQLKFFEVSAGYGKTSEMNLLSLKLSHKNIARNELTDFNLFLQSIKRPVIVNQKTGFYVKCKTGLKWYNHFV